MKTVLTNCAGTLLSGVASEGTGSVGDSLGHDGRASMTVGMRKAWLALQRGADLGDVRPAAVTHGLGGMFELVAP